MQIYNQRKEAQKKSSRISKRAILMAIIIWASYYLIQHLIGTMNVPAGFTADFYRGGVKTFNAIEACWCDRKSLETEEQEWIKKYLYGEPDLTEKEKIAAQAFKDYLYVSILGPRDKIKTDPEWARAYEDAKTKLVESLELK